MGKFLTRRHFRGNRCVGGYFGTVYVAVNIDINIDRSVSGRIPCNGVKEGVLGGVFRNDGLEIEGVWAVWSRIWNI